MTAGLMLALEQLLHQAPSAGFIVCGILITLGAAGGILSIIEDSKKEDDRR